MKGHFRVGSEPDAEQCIFGVEHVRPVRNVGLSFRLTCLVFTLCVLLVLVWSPSVVLFRNIDIADALADLMQEMADDRP